MSQYFEHKFASPYPRSEYEQEWERYEGMPLLKEVVAEAFDTIGQIEAFQALPVRNQELVKDMAAYILEKANVIQGSDGWIQNYWGLYVVGSRAKGEAREDSDLDLLSVGTFYRDMAFRHPFSSLEDEERVFAGFELEMPEELPSAYNLGDVDRKYLVRATPKDEVGDALPVDLSVVDLTFIQASLEGFKQKLDVDEAGEQLPRLPLVEVQVAADRWCW